MFYRWIIIMSRLRIMETMVKLVNTYFINSDSPLLSILKILAFPIYIIPLKALSEY